MELFLFLFIPYVVGCFLMSHADELFLPEGVWEIIILWFIGFFALFFLGILLAIWFLVIFPVLSYFWSLI